MKLRAKLLLTTAASALLMGVIPGTQALAADAMVVKAAPVEAGWWYHGYVEVGGRFYGPQHTGGATPGGANLAKFNEYRDLRPGPFGNIFMATGSNDGLYVVDFWAKNIGYDDQSYYLNFSKAGEHYLTLGWDETPHNYGTSVATIFNGTGTNSLTIDPAVRATLALQLAAANYQGVASTIANNSNTFALGFRRDTASVDYRWTPNNWDVKVDYSYTKRDGTQPQAALTYVVAKGFGSTELPKPINDTTHNGNVSAEYAGISPWGKKFNVNLAYGLSIYRQGNDVVNFQNPFVTVNAADSPVNNVLSLPPSNNANTFTLNGGMDLPWKSRDVFTAQYSAMSQDTAFSNYGICTGAFCGFTVNPLAAATPTITAMSLGANTGTTLINNTLTTQLTHDLKSTVRYRYYDITSDANSVSISDFLRGDAVLEGLAGSRFSNMHLPYNYQKQNANGDLVWNPLRWLTLGAGAGWERWDHSHRNVDVTNEYSGKVFADARLWDWSKMRSSFQYSERDYDNYQYTGDGTSRLTWQSFDLTNRNRAKGTFLWDFYAPFDVTFTPTAGFRWDDYGTNPYPIVGLNSNQLGLMHDHKWNAGLEVSWGFARNMTLFASYVHEEGWREQI